MRPGRLQFGSILSAVIPRSILCPVDFSEQSRHALRLAGVLATRYRSRLIVLSVVDPLLAEAARSRLKVDLAKTETEPALAEFVKATWPAGTPAIEAVLAVRVGTAAAAILDAAAREAVDVIVMGTHGLGGVRKWLLGSTTEHVLRRARTPVLVVPPIPPADSVSFEAGVLAAIDFSESSAAAATSAAQFAQQFNGPLLLAHVVEPVTVPPQWSSLLEESDEARMAEARLQLKALADQCAGPRTVETIVTPGRPAEAIGALAEERRAGLIVMGLTGEHGLFSRRPGSIAYRVLCSASVPVLVVPSAAVNT